jgi:hypothetical protein
MPTKIKSRHDFIGKLFGKCVKKYNTQNFCLQCQTQGCIIKQGGPMTIQNSLKILNELTIIEDKISDMEKIFESHQIDSNENDLLQQILTSYTNKK